MADARTWSRIKKAFERGATWKKLEAMGVNKGTISKRAKKEKWDLSRRPGPARKKTAGKKPTKASPKSKKKPAAKKKNTTRAESGNTRARSKAKAPRSPAPDDGGVDRSKLEENELQARLALELQEINDNHLLIAKNAAVVAANMIAKANTITSRKKPKPKSNDLKAASVMLERGTRALKTANELIRGIKGKKDDDKGGGEEGTPRVTADQWVQGHEDLPP